MDHVLSPAAEALCEHLRRRFPSREMTLVPATDGPIHQRVPGFHVVRLAPTPEEGDWLYVTAGLWDATQRDGHALEFILAAPAPSDRHATTLTMTAFYHAAGGRNALDHGHTVPIGQPWLPESKCRYLLVSLPYPWGRNLEVCPLPQGHARILWLLPITRAERDYKRDHGLEALEQKLEQADIIPSDPRRPSVIEAQPGRVASALARLRRR